MQNKILTDIEDPDVNIRRVAIRDLLSSKHPQKIEILKRRSITESDVQLKYELKKYLNEYLSIQKKKTPNKNINDIQKALDSDNIETVYKAFSYILKHRQTQFLPQMKEISKKRNDSLLRANIASLLSFTGQDSLNELQEFLKDEDPRVIACAIDSLMNLGSTNALANVVEFASHEDPRLKSTAIKALLKRGDESAFHLFEKMVQSEYSSYRESVVHALCEITHPRALFLLEKLLKDDVESIRSKALIGIQKLCDSGDLKAQKILSDNLQFKEKLTSNFENTSLEIDTPAALNSNDISLRMNALVEISKSDHTNAIHQIIERLKVEKEIKVISCALIALARVSGPDKLKIRFFMSYLSHKDHRIRASSIECLSTMIAEERKDFFLAYLNDENNRVIGNAIVALYKSNRYSEEFSYFVIKAILDLYNHQDENFSLTAIYCTGILQSKQLLPSLVKVVQSGNQKLKEKALEILSDWASEDNEAKTYLEEFENFTKEEAPNPQKSKVTSKNKAQAKVKPKAVQTSIKTKVKSTPTPTPKNLIIATQAYIILATIYSFYRWSMVLLSNEGNLYVRIFSLGGFLLCGIWILLGVLLPVLRKNGKNYLYAIVSLDFLFTLTAGMLIFVLEDVLAGCIFMFHGFGFLAVLFAFIHQLQKYNNFKS
ncbi:MAG: HEAT repeat domain-containing protein [Candidatus Cloacimonetes bacterium]|nr:HEAT repeat domain-containing protein [Candidatus Cloacimonadota bacterium]